MRPIRQPLNLPSLDQIIDRSPLTVTPDTLAIDALALMSQTRGSSCALSGADPFSNLHLPDRERTSCLLVVEGARLLGTFTERDVVKLTASRIDLSRVKIASVMTHKLITLTQSSSQNILTALSLLREHRIRHLPIVDRQGQLVGLVTPEQIRQVLQPANMLKLRRVGEVMSTDVIHAPVTESVLSLAKRMAERSVSCVVIVAEMELVTRKAGERGRWDDREQLCHSLTPLTSHCSISQFPIPYPASLVPVGIITERDIVQLQVLQLDLAATEARTVMSSPLFSLSAEDSLWTAHQQMQHRQVRRLVVSGKQGELLGILTQSDLLQLFDPIEYSEVVSALQQQIEKQTVQLRKVNQQLGHEIAFRHQIEQALIQARNDLEKRVEERTLELTTTNAQLQQEIYTRRQAEERIRFQATVLSHVNDAVIAVDNEYRISYWNQAAQRLYNLTADEVVGKPLEEAFEYRWLKAEDRQAACNALAACGFWRGENIHIKKSKEQIYAEVTVSVLKDEGGTGIGWLAVIRDISDRKRVEQELQRQIRRSQLFAEVTLKIRQSLQLEEILQTTVNEVQRILQADRVLIFQFKPDGSGRVVQEAVVPGWPVILGHDIFDPCLQAGYLEQYRQGRVCAIADIHTAQISPCHAEFLEQFDITANLVVPILIGGSGGEPEKGTGGQGGQGSNFSPTAPKLWGLLMAHQCAQPRQWSNFETELLQQLADQVGIALAQSQLLKALRKSEEQVRLALDFTHIGSWDWHLNTGELIWNENHFRLMGLVPDELAVSYQTWRDRVHPEDIDRVEQGLARALETHTDFEAEYRVIYPDGSLHWLVDRGRGVYNQYGQAVRMIGIVIDISDRKRAEEKISEQADLLDIATDAILVRDLNHKILFWNKGAERLYGWQAQEALGKNAKQLLCKEATEMEAALQTAIEKGEWQGELHKVTKNRNELLVSSRWTLVCNEAGEPQSILIVDTDITEKKQLESQFLRAQRLESIGTLAGGIAHDLNNVLTPILMSAQLMAMTLSDEKNQQRLALIESNAKRGADLVKQVLTFARGMEGKRIPLQVGHLLREIEQVARRTFPKSIQIDTDFCNQELWTVSADATQLHQVFMNLCINARDAMPDGGILRIFAENLAIDESNARRNIEAQVGSYVVVTIADTGVGISPENLDRIFDPFFTTKDVGQGTGLGLSTALGIVKNHGGFITVSSTVGSGSEVKVFLPAERHTTATLRANEFSPSMYHSLPKGGANTQTALKGNGKLILVVDDEGGICELAKTFLEACGYRVLSATDGIEAIALYTQHRREIAAVLMDIMMPSIDGLTCIRALQAINPQVRIIVMSGLASPEAIAKATNLGIEAFLPKPFSSEKLANTLNKVVAKISH